MSGTRKIKVKLKELRDADVTHVSLVDRSASRIPFRVMKSDKEHQNMSINLSDISRVFKREDAAKKATKAEKGVVVTALVIDGSNPEFVTKATSILQEHGFSVDKVVKNEDGTVLFQQVDNPTEGAELVRVSDNMVLVVKGFDPYSQTLRTNADFNEMVAANGFFSGLSTAFDGLAMTIQAELGSAQKAEDAVQPISDTLDKFSDYVIALVGALPSNAFKADAALAAAAKAQTVAKGDLVDIEALLTSATGKGGSLENVSIANPAWSTMSTVDKISWVLASYSTRSGGATLPATKGDKDKDGDNDTPPEGISQADWDKMSDEDKAKAKKATKSDTPDLAAALATALAPLSRTVQEIAAKQENQQKAIDEVVRKSDTVAQALKSTVTAPAVAGDTPAGGTQVVKTDSDPRTGCFDTANISRALKRDLASRRG